jgi:hypothetical protein
MGLLDILTGNAPSNDATAQQFLQSLLQPQVTPQPQSAAPFGFAPQTSFADRFAPALTQLSQQQPQQPAPQAAPDQPSPLDTAQWPAGPAGAPSQANAQASPAAADEGNDPIAVGNYQMPRIGDGFPDEVAPKPAPAAPAAATAALASPAPFSLAGNLGAAQKSFQGTSGLIPGIANAIQGMATGQPVYDKQTQAKNATVAALRAKNVPDADIQAAMVNPELMKTLITQTYGPQTVQSLGSGYIADKNGKVTRAYEPEDKIPAGFAKGDDGNMHFVPGGPADPAYLRLAEAQKKDPTANYVLGRGGEVVKNNPDGTITVLHKNAEGGDATLDDKTTKAMAAQYLAGDKSVMTNLGRGAQGAANIVKLRTEIYNQADAAGMDSKGIVNTFNEQAGALAGQRSIGTRAANISLAANEANNMIPIALEASAAVPRGEWMPWNKMVQAYQTGRSSPQLARFVAATNSLVNSYVRAVSPSGVPTDSMREHAYSMLNSAQSPQAYQAVTSIMQDEMKAAMAAPGQVRKELRGEGGAEAAPAATPDKAAVEAEMKRRGLL